VLAADFTKRGPAVAARGVIEQQFVVVQRRPAPTTGDQGRERLRHLPHVGGGPLAVLGRHSGKGCENDRSEDRPQRSGQAWTFSKVMLLELPAPAVSLPGW
jgi:hypothetical protein